MAAEHFFRQFEFLEKFFDKDIGVAGRFNSGLFLDLQRQRFYLLGSDDAATAGERVRGPANAVEIPPDQPLLHVPHMFRRFPNKKAGHFPNELRIVERVRLRE